MPRPPSPSFHLETSTASRGSKGSGSVGAGQANGGGHSSNGLGKLLPKTLSVKRRMKKRKESRAQEQGSEAPALDNGEIRGRRLPSRGQSDNDNDDDDDDDDDEEHDDRSFGSYESSADTTDVDAQPFARDGRPSSSSSPIRPKPPSAHPSLIGYLTTSSPEVQATHLASQTMPGRKSSARAVSPARAGSGDLKLGSPVIDPPSTATRSSSADRNTRATVPARIETNRPHTPPRGGDKHAPAIVNTPPTPTIDETFHTGSPERKAPSPVLGSDNVALRNVSGHRRSKSGSAGPSKLSNITMAPLTPTPETAEPGPQSATSGFFSSMISAAQNAATSIGSTIPGSGGIGIGGAKHKPSDPKLQASPATSQVDIVASAVPEPQPQPQTEEPPSYKESAVRTLGTGELSLSQLGLSDPSTYTAVPASIRFPDIVDTRARSESAPVDTPTKATDGDFNIDEPSSRPRSLMESHSGDQTPPRVEIVDPKVNGVGRSSSLRSAIKPHRKRGSSVTTGGTVGAALAAASASAVQPTTAFAAPKLTGFAIASKKRNRDFHSLFKSVPDDDYLIEDYSCALQREILAHGRLYVSEGHLCFSSNILGWTTTLVMSFDEIVSVEKRSTALLFKNGLMISTLHAKHIFASFTGRDATYDLIVNIWKLGHPTLTSTLNGVRLEGTGGDKTEKTDAQPLPDDADADGDNHVESDSDDESEEDGDDGDFSDDDHDNVDGLPNTQITEPSPAGGDNEKTAASRKASAMTVVNGSPTGASKEAPSDAPGGVGGFPGPATHAPTECGDAASHYDKVIGDDVIPAPLGKVYDLLFGQGSVAWMSKWLTVDQKCTDLQMEDNKGLSMDNRTRNFSYIKPLYASLGPKQTKCIISESLETLDFENAVNLSVSTQTPDVPSGNVFCVKTRYCLTWAENNATRVQANCTTEWSGKSWIKGAIEKGVVDGQTQYCKDVFAALKTAVSSRQRAPTGANNGTLKQRKKGKRSKALQSSEDTTEADSRAKKEARQDWGPLEPIHGIVEPVLDLAKPIFTGNIMYGLLVGLLVASWFGFGFAPGKPRSGFVEDVIGIYSPQRLAAYEEMWRREDTELWDWLDERVGLGRLGSDEDAVNARKKTGEPRTMEERVREERMDEREVEEAIRVTEERLKVLRDVVGKGSSHR